MINQHKPCKFLLWKAEARINELQQKQQGKLSEISSKIQLLRDISRKKRIIEIIDNYSFEVKNYQKSHLNIEEQLLEIIKNLKWEDILDQYDIQRSINGDMQPSEIYVDYKAISIIYTILYNLPKLKHNDLLLSIQIKDQIEYVEISFSFNLNFNESIDTIFDFQEYGKGIEFARTVFQILGGDIEFQNSDPTVFIIKIPIIKGGDMIIELLTKETISVGVKFVADQFKKMIDRINDNQLKQKIDEKEKEIRDIDIIETSDEDIVTVQNSMKNSIMVLPEELRQTIDSVESFIIWVEERVRDNYDDLIGVAKLVLRVLSEKRRIENDQQKQRKMLEMQSYLQEDINQLDTELRLANAGKNERRDLYKRIISALNFIRS